MTMHHVPGLSSSDAASCAAVLHSYDDDLPESSIDLERVAQLAF